MIKKIGIIGLGFVGGAIKHSIDLAKKSGHKVNSVLMDIDKSRGAATIQDIKACDVVFVCVPSPQSESGACDTSALESVLSQLDGYRGTIISKSTVPPAVYTMLGEKYPNLVHAPEFLTAANANADYVNGKFAIIGGSTSAHTSQAYQAIKVTQPHITAIHYCTIAEAALAKYTINTFLATKVIFMNEIKKLAESLNANYDTIKKLVSFDSRIGSSHLDVPGPDGQYGFGGACFPKDTAALLHIATQQNVDLSVLAAAVLKNNKVRA